MRSPSLQLLHALRATDYIVTALPRPLPHLHLCHQLRHPSISPPKHHHHRTITSSTSPQPQPRTTPRTRDRGPRSTETTQTDFSSLNVLSSVPAPTTAIDACLSDGFHFNSGLKIGGGSGCLLVGGEAFRWMPWAAACAASERGGDTGGSGDGADGSGGGDDGGTHGKTDRGMKGMMVNQKGQWEVSRQAWGLLELVWPKPDLLILGLGPTVYPLSPQTRRHINALGIRVDVQDTRNAAAQFNLLATERGVTDVAAALVPIGWRDGKGFEMKRSGDGGFG